jgi:hypothetical protein
LEGGRILQALSDVILDVLKNAGAEFGLELRKRRPGAGTVGSGGIAELLKKNEPRWEGACWEKGQARHEGGCREEWNSELHSTNLRRPAGKEQMGEKKPGAP